MKDTVALAGSLDTKGNEYSFVKDLIEKESLSKYIRILGYRQDTLKILKCMDFYISPSLSEGLPISVLEALASKVPTIATEIIGNKDILPNSVFAVLTEPNSPEALCRGIIKMIQLTRGERELLSRNAYNRIKNHFSVDEMANKTILLYNKVLNTKKLIYSFLNEENFILNCRIIFCNQCFPSR